MARSTFVTPSPQIKRRRAWPPDQWKLWRKHAHQVGEIVTAWNDLQAVCYRLFATLSEAKNPGYMNIAHGIWHSVQSDKTQREMMLAAARGALNPKSRALGQIKWF